MNIQTIQSEIIDVIQKIHNEDTLNDLKKHVDRIANGDNGHISANYSEEEQALIEQIREGVSPEITQQFHQLNQEQRERKLTDAEQQKLEKLIHTMEAADAKFIEAMIKLSKIWGVTTKEVRTKLDIQIPEPYVC